MEDFRLTASAAVVEVKLMQKMAFKYDVEVKEKGQVKLSVPLPPGARVTVFVIAESGEKFDALTLATQWIHRHCWRLEGRGYRAARGDPRGDLRLLSQFVNILRAVGW